MKVKAQHIDLSFYDFTWSKGEEFDLFIHPNSIVSCSEHSFDFVTTTTTTTTKSIPYLFGFRREVEVREEVKEVTTESFFKVTLTSGEHFYSKVNLLGGLND